MSKEDGMKEIEVLQWVRRPFEELKPGDTFRVVYPAGEEDKHWTVQAVVGPVEPDGNFAVTVNRCISKMAAAK